MPDEKEHNPAEEPAAPEGGVSADELKDDPGAPDKGVQWKAPDREHAAESGAAAAAEDAAGND